MKFSLAVLSLFVVIAACASSFTSPAQSGKTLKDFGILVGTAVDPTLLRDDPKYKAIIVNNAGFVEAENAFKWVLLHAHKNEYDFRQGDAVVLFAKEHGMPVRACCFVWKFDAPKWLGEASLQPKMAEILHEHIKTVAGHYRGKVASWDVVNEAFNAAGSLQLTHWYGRPGINVGPGTAYIAQAYKWAHAADPSAKLFYNDFDAEEINAKSDAIYAMVKDFKRSGIPIDGVGFQAHVTLAGIDYDSFRRNLARFVALGVEVQITELDVAIPRHSFFGYARQAKVFKQIVGACLDIPGCTAIQFWGMDDKHSWLTGADATLFDKDYAPKPAYTAVLDEIASRK